MGARCFRLGKQVTLCFSEESALAALGDVVSAINESSHKARIGNRPALAKETTMRRSDKRSREVKDRAAPVRDLETLIIGGWIIPDPSA